LGRVLIEASAMYVRSRKAVPRQNAMSTAD
jgi:hypothetical protein